jgi:hypothetical protein
VLRLTEEVETIITLYGLEHEYNGGAWCLSVWQILQQLTKELLRARECRHHMYGLQDMETANLERSRGMLILAIMCLQEVGQDLREVGDALYGLQGMNSTGGAWYAIRYTWVLLSWLQEC